jgi:SAM-dependent methyltransferase
MESLDSKLTVNANSLKYVDHHADRLHERRLAELKPNFQHDLSPFISHLPACGAVLDWGCGVGLDLAYLAWNGFQVSGIDQSENILKQAIRNCPGAELHHKNGLMFSVKASTLDGVWIRESLNDLPSEEAQRVLAIAFRGLKAGGILGVIVKEGSGVFEDREEDLMGPSRTVFLYSEKALCSMIEQTGFSLLTVGRRNDFLMVIAKRI